MTGDEGDQSYVPTPVENEVQTGTDGNASGSGSYGKEKSALKAMVSFFTIWQQDLTQEDMDSMDRNFHLAPIVGALIGLVLLVETAILTWLRYEGYFGSTLFTAIAILLTVYVGSRFLHFDGLADFGDGSIVAGTKEDHVRALKDTLLGAGGLGVALMVTLLSVSLYSMVAAPVIILAVVTEILVKNAQVSAAAYGIPGTGMAGKQVAETNFRSLQLSTAISLVLALVMGIVAVLVTNLVYDMEMYGFGEVIVAIVLGLVASVITGYLMARRSNRVFGMVNGDILGATNEISRVVILIFMLIPLIAR